MTAAIREIYRQVGAPTWAAPNLDGLADVLRDLSWLPPGPVVVHVPVLAGADVTPVVRVLLNAEIETAEQSRPVRVIVG